MDVLLPAGLVLLSRHYHYWVSYYVLLSWEHPFYGLHTSAVDAHLANCYLGTKGGKKKITPAGEVIRSKIHTKTTTKQQHQQTASFWKQKQIIKSTAVHPDYKISYVQDLLEDLRKYDISKLALNDQPIEQVIASFKTCFLNIIQIKRGVGVRQK